MWFQEAELTLSLIAVFTRGAEVEGWGEGGREGEGGRFIRQFGVDFISIAE
jgi:hypothetical protein